MSAQLSYLAFTLLVSIVLANWLQVHKWPPILVVVAASALGVCLIGLWKLIGE